MSEISAVLSRPRPRRLNDENSRAKFQNVHGDSSGAGMVLPGGIHTIGPSLRNWTQAATRRTLP